MDGPCNRGPEGGLVEGCLRRPAVTTVANKSCCPLVAQLPRPAKISGELAAAGPYECDLRSRLAIRCLCSPKKAYAPGNGWRRGANAFMCVRLDDIACRFACLLQGHHVNKDASCGRCRYRRCTKKRYLYSLAGAAGPRRQQAPWKKQKQPARRVRSRPVSGRGTQQTPPRPGMIAATPCLVLRPAEPLFCDSCCPASVVEIDFVRLGRRAEC